MLKQEGKVVVTHKPAISAEDMDKIHGSLDLDDHVGLQDKVFIDVMLYFCNRGRENLREMIHSQKTTMQINQRKAKVVS